MNSFSSKYILEDPEKTFSLVKTSGGMLTGAILIATGATFAMHYVEQGEPINVYLSTLLAWSGYLFAHYVATGKFIHQRKHQHVVPHNLRNILGGIFGILMLIAGVTVSILAGAQGDLLVTIAGIVIGFTGYLISHVEFCGELL